MELQRTVGNAATVRLLSRNANPKARAVAHDCGCGRACATDERQCPRCQEAANRLARAVSAREPRLAVSREADDIQADEDDQVEDGETDVVGIGDSMPGDQVADVMPQEALVSLTEGYQQTVASRWITSIDVDLTAQRLVLHWSDGTDSPPHNVSTGRGRKGTRGNPCQTQQEVNCTPPSPPAGFPMTSRGDEHTQNSHGDAMAWYVGFIDSRGIGIHNSQRVIAGVPLSHGCVRTGNTRADRAFARLINENVRLKRGNAAAGTFTVVHVTGRAPTRPW